MDIDQMQAMRMKIAYPSLKSNKILRGFDADIFNIIWIRITKMIN